MTILSKNRCMRIKLLPIMYRMIYEVFTEDMKEYIRYLKKLKVSETRIFILLNIQKC